MPYQSFRAILYVTYDPSSKISTLLNQLQNEGSFLWNHENLHQIYQNVIVFFFQFIWQIPKLFINILMGMTPWEVTPCIF